MAHPDARTEIIWQRLEAEKKAWRSLAGYKFWMFGYHAAQWVLLNRMLPAPFRRGNPWAVLVKIARGVVKQAGGVTK